MNEIGDFRILSIGNRERILRWGLRDRDANVKKAAVKMFAHKWVEQANNNVLEVCDYLFSSANHQASRTSRCGK